MFCPQCGKQIPLQDQKFCDSCGFDLSKVSKENLSQPNEKYAAPVQQSVSLLPKRQKAGVKKKRYWIAYVALAVMVISITTIMTIVRNTLNETEGTRGNVALNYDISSDKLRDAEKKLKFTEASWWYGGRPETGEVLKQYVNVHVVTQGTSKSELSGLVAFYKVRFAGAEALRVSFWSHPARIAINGDCYSGAPRGPKDLTSYYPDPVGEYLRESNGKEEWNFFLSESEKRTLRDLLENR